MSAHLHTWHSLFHVSHTCLQTQSITRLPPHTHTYTHTTYTHIHVCTHPHHLAHDFELSSRWLKLLWKCKSQRKLPSCKFWFNYVPQQSKWLIIAQTRIIFTVGSKHTKIQNVNHRSAFVTCIIKYVQIIQAVKGTEKEEQNISTHFLVLFNSIQKPLIIPQFLLWSV